MSRLWAELTLVTSFQDADPMGVIYHGNYFRYFEEVRRVLMEKIDYSYLQMRASGYMYPIIETRVKYVRPVKFQHRIRITAELAEWENRLRVDYVIYDADTNQRLTKGYTMQVAVNIETGEMCLASPKILGEKLRAYHARNE